MTDSDRIRNAGTVPRMSRSSCGVDGCRGGWFYFALRGARYRFGVVTAVTALLELIPFRLACIDIPIGLPTAKDPPRRCDQLARGLLGPRRSSVFSPPIREVLGLASHAQANARSRKLSGRGLSCQSFNITAKIAEVDQLLAADPALVPRFREAHPELCFWGLAGGRPMAHNKKTQAGFEERMHVLVRHWPNAALAIQQARATCAGAAVARDDLVDALALAITAARPLRQLSGLTDANQRDSTGLAMDMVYFKP